MKIITNSQFNIGDYIEFHLNAVKWFHKRFPDLDDDVSGRIFKINEIIQYKKADRIEFWVKELNTTTNSLNSKVFTFTLNKNFYCIDERLCWINYKNVLFKRSTK